MKFNTELIYKNNKDLNFFNNKINILKNELKKLMANRSQLLQKNSKIKKDIKNYMGMNNMTNKNKINEVKLKNEYKKIKEENIMKRKQLKIEENEIEKLKRSIDNVTNNIENDFNFNINYNFGNNIIYNGKSKVDYNIDNKIEKARKDNTIADINLNNAFIEFEDKINKKEEIIKNLKNQIYNNQTSLNKYNENLIDNYNNIDKLKNEKNKYSKKVLLNAGNSINELAIDESGKNNIARDQNIYLDNLNQDINVNNFDLLHNKNKKKNNNIYNDKNIKINEK